jgi:alkylation response protein AidB-like acyl-CoA dehydrogenase
MQFVRDEEHQMLVDTVRRFAREVLQESAETHDRRGAVNPELSTSLAELGLFGLLLPESEGGFDAPACLALDVVEELAVADGAVGWLAGGHLTAVGASARTEAIAADEMAAALAGDGWWGVATATATRSAVLRRIWVPDRGGGRLEFARAGFEPSPTCLGLRGAGLGRTGRADHASQGGHADHASQGGHAAGSGSERGTAAPGSPDPGAADPGAVLFAPEGVEAVAAAVALGVGRAALEAARIYAQERSQFGRPIADFQAVQWKLADGLTALDGARLLLHHGVAHGDRFSLLFGAQRAADAAVTAAWEAVQIYGGNGFIREYPVERHLRDAQTVRAWLISPPHPSDFMTGWQVRGGSGLG